jgi:hypothetical protein
LHRDLSVNVDRDFTVDVNWFVDVDYFLCYCGNFDCPDYLFNDFEWHFLLYFNVLWYFNDLLHNPFWPWDSPGDFDNNFNWFLDNNFLYNLLWHDGLMSLNLCVSVLQKSPQHLQLNLDLILFTFKIVHNFLIFTDFLLYALTIIKLQL